MSRVSIILISEFMDEDSVAVLEASHEVEYRPELFGRTDELRAAAGTADALIVRNRTRVDASVLDAAPRLRVVGRLGVGLDNIDLDTCRERGIDVIPATGANANAVAEYVIGAALVLTRGVFRSTELVAAGEWPRESLVGGELDGKTLGCVGFGATARRVATIAHGMSMKTVAFDPLIEPGDPLWGETASADLESVAEASDVVSIHVPLVDETRGLVDGAFLARMKPTAILINTARGGIVDEAALRSALVEGSIAGAAVDVFEEEPLSADAGAQWMGIPNLLLTPHVAGVTHESNREISRFITDAVLHALDGGRS